MSANADTGRHLPAHAKHAFGHLRSVQQRDFKATGKVCRALFEYYRQVQGQGTYYVGG